MSSSSRCRLTFHVILGAVFIEELGPNNGNGLHALGRGENCSKQCGNDWQEQHDEPATRIFAVLEAVR